MDPAETAKSYDRLAGYWDGDQLNRDNGIAQHHRALQFLTRKGIAIDVGCGSSGRIIELLLSEGFAVEGLDISPDMLARAKRRHPELTFHFADICEWEFPHPYDFISAWDSIWHAPLEMHETVLVKLCSALTDGGVLIFTAGGLDEPDEGTSHSMEQPLYHATLGIPKLLEIVANCQCVCRHLEYDQYPEKHLYLIVQKNGSPVDGLQKGKTP